MGILANENAIGGGGYQISNSLRFQSAGSTFLSRTPASVGTSNKIMTFSAWVKRGAFASLNGLFTASVDGIQFWNNNIDVFFNNGTGGTRITTSAVYRDPAAWYHVVVVVDTTQANSANRVQIYLNGSLVTATTGTPPSQNYVFNWNQNSAQRFGTDAGANYFDGYITEANVIDGQALSPSSFGEFDVVTGQWVAKKYTGTYGTNGFYLPFSNGTSTTTLGADGSGNGNSWTLNNFTRSAGISDCWMKDVPSGNGSEVGGTQPSSNYCVMSAVSTYLGYTVVNNGLDVRFTNFGNVSFAFGTMFVSSGKWYWEGQITAIGGGDTTRPNFGIVSSAFNYSAATGTYNIGSVSSGWAYERNGAKSNNAFSPAYGAAYTTGDVIGVALDMDAGTVTFYKNGVSQGQAYSGITGLITPAVSGYALSSVNSIAMNFGQRSFAYSPPSGFKALCTANLPTASIKKGAEHFDVKTYTGNGNSTTGQLVSYSFQPSLSWVKERTTTEWHNLYDALRGANALFSNATDAEGNIGGVVFDPAGIYVKDIFRTNENALPYVAWSWKESALSGLDVITYSGNGTTQNITHNLGTAPAMIIVKSRNIAQNWLVYHKTQGAGKYLLLQGTNASTSATTPWNNTAPSSSVFSVGADNGTNGTGNTYVAYTFAEVPGFSKFDAYTGNGNADGTFVYTGFRPKFVMIKRADSGDNWMMLDTSRNTFNSMDTQLAANLSNSEGGAATTGNALDFLSNGFKLRSLGTRANANGGTYIYMAFAENPFQNSNAR